MPNCAKQFPLIPQSWALFFWSLEFSRYSQSHITGPPLGPLLEDTHSLGLQIRQNSDSSLVSGIVLGPPAALRSPQARARRALPSGLSVSPRKVPETLAFAEFLRPQAHLARLRVRQDVGRPSPASRKTTGHCPQFPPNLGIVPGSSNGLGVAPGHWGLTAPGVSLTFSAVRRRPQSAVSCLGSSRARGRSLQPRGELPAASARSAAPARTPRRPARGRRSPRAAARDAGAARGNPLRACCAGRPCSLGPGAPKPAPLSFALLQRR